MSAVIFISYFCGELVDLNQQDRAVVTQVDHRDFYTRAENRNQASVSTADGFEVGIWLFDNNFKAGFDLEAYGSPKLKVSLVPNDIEGESKKELAVGACEKEGALVTTIVKQYELSKDRLDSWLYPNLLCIKDPYEIKGLEMAKNR